MRRFAKSLVALSLSAFALSSTGCLAVSATDNSRGVRQSRAVVAVGNAVYIVDTRTGCAERVDLTQARPIAAPMHEDVSATDVD